MGKLKKLISILLSCAIMLTMAGCQSKNKGKNVDISNVTVASQDTQLIYNDDVIARSQLMVIDEFKKQINSIALKYLDEEDLNNVSVESIYINKENVKLALDLKIEKVKNINKLKKFLKYVSQVIPINGFSIYDTLLDEIAIDYDEIESLKIKSSTDSVTNVSLENFKNIKFLGLERVVATNLPKSVISIDFIGSKDPEANIVDKSYSADVMLRQLGWLDNIYQISFENMNVSHVSVPITKVISLTFKNCTGLTNVYISDSDIVEIHNYNDDGINYNDITVLGRINNELIVISPNYNVHTGQVKGDAQVSYYIETPGFVVAQGDAQIETSTLTLKQ